MNDEQLARYARHILLDEFGFEGQQKLLVAHALIIGVGGLGCAVAPYLAAAGVATLTLVDDDIIALSNLQRQTLFSTSDLGQKKVTIARQRLLQLNPGVDIRALSQRADIALLQALVAQADVVIDCSDNFVTRQAINQVCVESHTPLISGAVVRFGGQISVFDLRMKNTPCYACVFSPAHPFNEESCALMGVFSPAVGLVGATQAAEALKLLSGMEVALASKLLTLNAQTLQWTMMPLQHDPNCPVCGVAPSLPYQ